MTFIRQNTYIQSNILQLKVYSEQKLFLQVVPMFNLKIMKNFSILFLSVISITLISCENEELVNKTNPIFKESITGTVQKGPFLNGTSITVSELNGDFLQTGKVFNTQISDKKGNFKFERMDLSTQYVELKATGYYFNEIVGKNSPSQLTLYALSDLSDKSSLNINLLSHLERDRMIYLLAEGMNFNSAKKQAQQEILRIFSFEMQDMLESELLDISRKGNNNAALLAISSIIQGYRTDAELSELIANISTDIREDGVLDDSNLGSNLLNHAKGLNVSRVRENLTSKYKEMGVAASIPNFQDYVSFFTSNTSFEYTGLIDFPKQSEYGNNILNANMANLKAYSWYSLAANLPEGSDLTIVMKGGIWHYEVLPNGPKNWNTSNYDENEQIQTFVSSESGKACDLRIKFILPEAVPEEPFTWPELINSDTLTLEYYVNMSEEPSQIRTLIIER